VSRSASTRSSGFHVGISKPQCRTHAPWPRSSRVVGLQAPATGMRSRLVAIGPADHIDDASRPGKSTIPDSLRTGAESDVRVHSHSGAVKPDVSTSSRASVLQYRFFPLNGNRHAPAGCALELGRLCRATACRTGCREGVPCRFRRRVGSRCSLRLSASIRE
jgi:hypothetical protein